MEDYVSRMITELEELQERTSKLKKAISNDEFLKKIGTQKASLLNMQYHVMEAYREILEHRLVLEDNER